MNLKPNPEVQIREPKPGDRGFLFASWLNCYKNESRFARAISRDTFFEFHHQVIERILARPTTQVLIAHYKNEPDLILGFLVWESSATAPVVHFVFVKKGFRETGIAASLFTHTKIDPNAITYTHATYSLDMILPQLPNAHYNPYLI